jgi:hypothetical protein
MVPPALAQEEPAFQGQGGGVRGQVTEVSDSILTISTRAGQTVNVNVTPETKIILLDQESAGNLSDIQVGDWAGVRGPKNEDGSIQARVVAVLPQEFKELERIRGKVTTLEGSTIVVRNLRGTQRLTTTAKTKFRIGPEAGNLSDITPDNFVLALGKTEGNEFTAQFVVAIKAEQVKKHMLRGEVLSVDTSTGTLTVQARGGQQKVFTVKTTAETKFRIPQVDDPTLADISVGAQVLVLGKLDQEGSQSGTARLIAVIPSEFQGSRRALGEVTAVSGATFTLKTVRRGEVAVVTGDSTQYRTRGGQAVSLADVKVGSTVLVIGEPVPGQDQTIQAKLVGIKVEK